MTYPWYIMFICIVQKYELIISKESTKIHNEFNVSICFMLKITLNLTFSYYVWQLNKVSNWKLKKSELTFMKKILVMSWTAFHFQNTNQKD